MGLPEAPGTVSVGLRLRSCYLALPRHHNFLSGFETAIWPVSSSPSTPYNVQNSQQLCHGTSRGPTTSCFCWASKLLSGISEALQPVSIGLRNCHPARFQQPLKPLKPCHGTSRGPTKCFCWKLPSGNVSVGLRSCYLAFPRRHELRLLVFETVILHVFSTP